MLYNNASNYRSPEGTFTVILHGAPGQAYGPDGKAISAEDLVHMILNNQDFMFNRDKYKKIRLLECRAGQEGKKEQKSVRDQLKEALHFLIPVEATDSRVQINPNGTVTTAGTQTPPVFY